MVDEFLKFFCQYCSNLSHVSPKCSNDAKVSPRHSIDRFLDEKDKPIFLSLHAYFIRRTLCKTSSLLTNCPGNERSKDALLVSHSYYH